MGIKIRKYIKEDLVPCSELVKRTYQEFCFADGNLEASKKYIDIYDTRKDIDRARKIIESAKIFFVAIDDDRIIGLARGNMDRIVGLFVDGKYQKKGIGRELVKRFEKEAKKLGSKEIKIRSSLYGVPFYLKEGYKKTTGIRMLIGIKVQPMRKILW